MPARVHHPRHLGSLTVTLRTWQRARRCPCCDELTRVLVVAQTPTAAAYGYCPACWAMTEAAYRQWLRPRP